MPVTKLSADQLRSMKGNQLIPMLTAYNCPIARCIERANIPVILVGDSLAMVEMGYKDTRQITIEHMLYHLEAVRRGAPETHVIGDMTYESDTDPELALKNAQALINAGADSVKLEGPKYAAIALIVSNGIDVVGHTGLTPQTAEGFKQVGKDKNDAQRISKEASMIEQSGAFMLVLEHIPAELGTSITGSVTIPTIGIGAGSACDGQVMVINDAIGMGDFWPPFSKQYADVDRIIGEVANTFKREVEEKKFP